MDSYIDLDKKFESTEGESSLFGTLGLYNCGVGKNLHADVCIFRVNKIESIEGYSTLARSLLISAASGSISHKCGEVGILSHLVSR
jgi:hypothetical protein